MQPERGLEPGRPPAFAPSFPIRVDRSWIPAGALLAAHLAFSVYGRRSLGSSVTLGLLTAALLFGLVVLHGLAHLVAGWLTRSPRGPMRLYVFGDVTEVPRTAIVALAGPLVSAAAGGALFVLSTGIGETPDVLRAGAWTSLGLAAINLAPGLPLDGGHLLASLTRRRRLAMRIGQLFGLLAVICGSWLLVSAPAVLEETAFGLWLLLVGIFVLVEGRATGTAVQRAPLDGFSAGAWARPFAGRVKAEDPVPLSGGPYAVSDGTRLAGVLSAGGAAPPGTRCADVMVPWTSQLGVRATTPLREALSRLAEPGGRMVVVVDETGIVRGVLDEEAVRSRIVAS
jgi:Zn-dependent protease